MVKRVALFALFAFLLLLLAGVLVLWRSGDQIRDVAIAALGEAMGMEVELAGLEVDLFPPRVVAHELAIGRPNAVALRRGDLQIDLRASLRSRRLQVALDLEQLQVDLAQVPGEDGATAEPQGEGSVAAVPLPATDLTLRITGAHLALDERHSLSLSDLMLTAAVENVDAIRLDLAAGGLEMVQDERLTRLGDLDARADWVTPGLSVESLELRGGAISVSARPESPPPSTPAEAGIVPAQVALRGEIGPVIDFLAGEPVGISGEIDVDGRIDGALDDPQVVATARVERVDLVGMAFDEITMAVQRSAGVVWAREIEAAWEGGRLVGDFKLLESSLELTGRVGWRDVDTASLLGGGAEWRSRSFGDATVKAVLDPLDVAVAGDGRIAADGTEELPIQFHVKTDGEQIAGSAEFRVDADNRVRMEIDNFDEKSVVGRLDAGLQSIDRVASALGYTGRLPLSGGLTASAVLSGSASRPQAEIAALLEQGRLADGSALEFAARLVVSPESAIIDALALRVGAGTLRGSGVLAIGPGVSNEWTLRADRLALTPLVQSLRMTAAPDLPPVEGTLNLGAVARGSWDGLHAEADLDAAGAVVGGIALGTVTLGVRSRGGSWEANLEVEGSSGGGRLSASARGDGSALSGIDADLRQWPLAALVTAGETEIGGSASVRCNIEVGADGARGAVEATVGNLVVGDEIFGDSTVRAVGDGGPWRIEGYLLGESLLVDGRVEAVGELPFVVRLVWDDADLPSALIMSEGLSVKSTGELRASGRLKDVGALDAALEVTSLEIASGRRRLGNQAPIRITYDAGDLNLETATIAGGRTSLTVGGRARPDGHSRAKVEGTLALVWLEHFMPAVDAAAGVLDLDVEFVGAPQAVPQLTGTVSLRDGAFEMGGAPPMSGVRGEISLASSRLTIESLQGDIGGGRFQVDGTVDLEDGLGLRWSIQNVSVEPTYRLELVVTGNGGVSGPWDKTTLSGEVTISDLLYDRNIEFQDLIPSFDRAVRPPPARRSTGPPLRLDLRVSARDGLYVENNIANLEARTDLRITGNAEMPRVRGSIEVIDGRLMLRGRSFEIVTGNLRFRPDNPGLAQIDFMAESVIESRDTPYNVQVRVTGTTADFRVTLASEDGLSQTDIASLIAFGRTMAEMQEGGGDGGLSMDALAGIAGGRVGQVLAGEVREVLPFDEVELRPGFSPSTGEFEPQIRVGKHLTEDLSAWIAQTFGVRSQTAVEASYALTRQIAAILRWESQTAAQEGAFGGEISQRFHFWGRPSWLRWRPAARQGAGE